MRSAKKLTANQLAKRLGVSCQKVCGWIRAGDIPAVNVAGRLNRRAYYLINDDDAAAFEASRAVVPPTQGGKP